MCHKEFFIFLSMSFRQSTYFFWIDIFEFQHALYEINNHLAVKYQVECTHQNLLHLQDLAYHRKGMVTHHYCIPY